MNNLTKIYKENPITHRERNILYRKSHPEKVRVWEKTRRARARRLVIIAYGGVNPCCVCCGESTYEFLGIDHINGGGAKERKEVGHGRMFYSSLKKRGYPKGYQILCYNCNLAKGFYGKCPHKTLPMQKTMHKN